VLRKTYNESSRLSLSGAVRTGWRAAAELASNAGEMPERIAQRVGARQVAVGVANLAASRIGIHAHGRSSGPLADGEG
jgi:hypothetical protein